MSRIVNKTFTANAQETDAVSVPEGHSASISVQNATGGTVQLQRRFRDGDTWRPVKSYADVDAEETYDAERDTQLRFITTTAVTSTIFVEIGASRSRIRS